MSSGHIDVDAALAELQHLISSVSASDASNVDAGIIAQRLRSLERELRSDGSLSRGPSAATTSPSPRRLNSLTQIPQSLQAHLVSRPSSPPSVVKGSSSAAATPKTFPAPEPSLTAIRRSVSLAKDVAMAPINVMTGGAMAHPGGAEEKWQLSRGASSNATGGASSGSGVRGGNLFVDPATSGTSTRAATQGGLDVSFAQQYAVDDAQRLRFVIDAVSNQLHKERRWRRQLQHNVIPVLLQRVDDLENERQQWRQDFAAAQHEVTALRLQHALGGRHELMQQVDVCLERVAQLLQQLEA